MANAKDRSTRDKYIRAFKSRGAKIPSKIDFKNDPINSQIADLSNAFEKLPKGKKK